MVEIEMERKMDPFFFNYQLSASGRYKQAVAEGCQGAKKRRGGMCMCEPVELLVLRGG